MEDTKINFDKADEFETTSDNDVVNDNESDDDEINGSEYEESVDGNDDDGEDEDVEPDAEADMEDEGHQNDAEDDGEQNDEDGDDGDDMSISNNENDDEDDVEDMDDDMDDDSSVEMDEDNFNTFDENLRTQIVEKTHTLLKVNNMHEIKALAKITRDVHGKVIDPLHKTHPVLTKYEKAKILGIRCNQINSGCPAFIDVSENEIDGYNIAEKELYAKKNPFIIKRPLPNGTNEYWYVNDLELL